MSNKIAVLLGVSAALAATAAAAAEFGSSAQGRWLTEKKGAVVEIYRCTGEALCGRLVWFRMKPEETRINPAALDLNNPTPDRRNKPLCGAVIIYGFKAADEPGAWEGGTVYDPQNGKSYNATMKLQADGSLRLRGYIGISLIGASETWTRYEQTPPACPTR